MNDRSEHAKRFIRLINGDSINEDRIGAACISDSVEVGSGPWAFSVLYRTLDHPMGPWATSGYPNAM